MTGNDELNVDDIKMLKEIIQLAEEGTNPKKYIATLSLRQGKILLAALNMGKAEPLYETEIQNIKRMEHNAAFPNNPIPEPRRRSDDTYSLFKGYISDCNYVGNIIDVINKFEQIGAWKEVPCPHQNFIKRTLIILDNN